jgi:outer membrane protein assembly factor BamB
LSGEVPGRPEDLNSGTVQTVAGSGRFRWKSAALILLTGGLGTLAAAVFAPDQTFRVIALYYVVGATLSGLLIWWLTLRRISLTWRLGGLTLALLLLAGLVRASVSEVYFDGDMKPRFRWVWQESPAARTAEWLRNNSGKANTGPESVGAEFDVTEGDWPAYCGRDSARVISGDRPVSPDWVKRPPRELWRHPVGEAWSSFAVVGNWLFTQEQRADRECVVCYRADTGAELWHHEDTARYETPMGAVGPRATPTVTKDRLFALGATGILNCLHPLSGTAIWQTSILKDSGGTLLEWGMSGSPLFYEGLVIVDAGSAQGRAVIAYDAASGSIKWSSENHQAGYAAPRIEQIGGQPQLLIFHGEGLLALNPNTGVKLWEYSWTNIYKINVAQPIRFGDQIFISSGYDSGCVLLDALRIVNGKPAEVWSPAKSLKLKFNEAVAAGDYVYGLDDGILSCIDLRTGERKWKGGRYRYGQVLLWKDLLLIQAEKGSVALVEVRPDRFTEVTRFEPLDDRTWNVPVVCRSRLYVRNANEAACYSLGD